MVAVDAALNGASYRDVFKLMKQHGFSEKDAETIARRVKRGLRDTSKPGGFPKDSVYLTGLFQVEDYLDHGGKIETLYSGCISVEQAPLIEKMINSGELRRPKYVPEL